MQTLIANRTWNNFHWPEWVPTEIRQEIMRFHSDSFGRGPESWLDCSIRNKAPIFGTRVRIETMGQRETVTGRYVHAWNNIGRVVSDDGNIEYVGCYKFEISENGMWKEPEQHHFSTLTNTMEIGLLAYARQTDNGDTDNEN